jgi:hypothetical protein
LRLNSMINVTTLGAVRTVIIVNARAKLATTHRYTNNEMDEVFGPAVVAEINAGNRAIWRTRYDKNLVVFDAMLAAISNNADLFKDIPKLTQD